MKKYALIGSSLSHSYSKIIHDKLYKKYNLNYSYELINTEKEGLQSLVDSLKTNEYYGFNVTIPYKKDILNFVEVFSPTVNEVDCCNTIQIVNKKVCAYNTDFYGFDYLLNFHKLKFESALILGSGATSRTVAAVLDSKMIDYKIISRSDKVYNYDYVKKNIKNNVIINTTPVGMFPNTSDSVLTKEIAKDALMIIDLIYNPRETTLMSYNKKSYNGLAMLVYQACKSFEYWTGIKVDITTINEIIKDIEVM